MSDPFVMTAAVLLLAAAAWDIRSYRIPNGLGAALAGLFVLRAVLMPDHAAAAPAHLSTAVVALAVGALLFARGLIGGGDAKLFAAAVLWVPPPLVPGQVRLITLSGAALALLLLALRRIARQVRPGNMAALLQDGAPIPYGVAIALGTVAQLAPP